MFLFRLSTLQIKALLSKDTIVLHWKENVPKHLVELSDRRLYSRTMNERDAGSTFEITERGKEVRQLLIDLQDQEILFV